MPCIFLRFFASRGAFPRARVLAFLIFGFPRAWVLALLFLMLAHLTSCKITLFFANSQIYASHLPARNSSQVQYLALSANKKVVVLHCGIIFVPLSVDSVCVTKENMTLRTRVSFIIR